MLSKDLFITKLFLSGKNITRKHLHFHGNEQFPDRMSEKDSSLYYYRVLPPVSSLTITVEQK